MARGCPPVRTFGSERRTVSGRCVADLAGSFGRPPRRHNPGRASPSSLRISARPCRPTRPWEHVEPGGTRLSGQADGAPKARRPFRLNVSGTTSAKLSPRFRRARQTDNSRSGIRAQFHDRRPPQIFRRKAECLHSRTALPLPGRSRPTRARGRSPPTLRIYVCVSHCLPVP